MKRCGFCQKSTETRNPRASLAGEVSEPLGTLNFLCLERLRSREKSDRTLPSLWGPHTVSAFSFTALVQET